MYLFIFFRYLRKKRAKVLKKIHICKKNVHYFQKTIDFIYHISILSIFSLSPELATIIKFTPYILVIIQISCRVNIKWQNKRMWLNKVTTANSPQPFDYQSFFLKIHTKKLGLMNVFLYLCSAKKKYKHSYPNSHAKLQQKIGTAKFFATKFI